MRLNRYFFKKQWHTLRKKSIETFYRSKMATSEFWDRLPQMAENIRAWFRENTLWEDGKYFLQVQYERLVTRGEYTRYDLVVLFIIAFSVGVAFKAAATQVITIGFEDYTLPPKEMLLNLNTVQKKMAENGSAFIENDAVQGGACSE